MVLMLPQLIWHDKVTFASCVGDNIEPDALQIGITGKRSRYPWKTPYQMMVAYLGQARHRFQIDW